MSFGVSSGSGSLSGGTDVALSNPADGQVLGYNGSLAKWQNRSLTTGSATTLTPTLQSTNYTALANDYVAVNATNGTVTITLPAAPADKAQIGGKKLDTSTNTVTFVTTGADVFNAAGGSTSIVLSLRNQGVTLQYSAGSAVWYVLTDDLPLSQLDLRYAPISGSAASLVITQGNLGTAAIISLGNKTGQTVTATANTASATLAWSNIAAGADWTLALTQDGTGGRTITSWTGVTWIPAGPPVLNPNPSGVDIFSFFSPDGSVIYGFPATNQSTGSLMPYYSSSRLETIPAVLAGQSSQITNNGYIYLTHFIPDRDFVASKFLTTINSTVAAGATLAKLGIYKYNGAGSYACIARTANNTSLWTTTALQNPSMYDDGAASPNLISTITLRAGVEYAAASIIVGATSLPRLTGIGTVAGLGVGLNGTGTRIASYLTAQTDLPSTITTNANPTNVMWIGFQ